MNKSYSIRLLALAAAVSLAGGFLGGSWAVNRGNSVVRGGAAERVTEKTVYVEESQIIDTVKAISPSVISVVITKDLPLYRQQLFNFNDFFGSDPFFNFGEPFAAPELDRDESGQVKTERRKVGGGSGFIVSQDGLAVTNRHVVSDEAANYTVILNDGTEYAANVLSRDTVNDIALLRIVDENGDPVTGLQAAPLGDSGALKIGQRVIAIGNALAEYENTVTTGVVSATGRSITAGSVNAVENLIGLIQTDAAINPGNSGGPLLNLEGQVIGINTAIAANAQGIGFAIPINDVKNVIASVQQYGKIVRPYLGVRFMMLTKQKAEELKIDVEGGALLVGNEAEGEFAVIPGGPADKAGLKIKDVILEVDGKPVTLENPLHILVGRKNPGDTVTLNVWRSGEKMEIKVALEEAK